MIDEYAINESFHRKFKKVHYELELLELKIDQTEGWIFKNHVYDQNELLNSEHHRRIDSITGKIGDDVTNWVARGKLSEKGKGIYYNHRDKVEDELHNINMEITLRQPTWWESAKGACTEFATKIMNNLPMFKGFLSFLEKIPGPIGIVAALLHTSTKKLLRLGNK